MSDTPILDLPSETRRRVEEIAAQKNVPAEAIVREAVDDYLAREDGHAAAWRDALDAWEDYQKTGLHLTNDEVLEWLDKVARGEDAELPACHT